VGFLQSDSDSEFIDCPSCLSKLRIVAGANLHLKTVTLKSVACFHGTVK